MILDGQKERIVRIPILVAFFSMALITTAAWAQPSAAFHGMGARQPSGNSTGFGVSGDGVTGVGFDSSFNAQAFRWTKASGMTLLGFLPGRISSNAQATSADGSVVVGRSSVGDEVDAYRWTESGGMVALGDLPGNHLSVAYDVSADGATVVGRSDNNMGGFRAFRWTPSTGMVDLGSLPGTTAGGWARGVSADGSVVAGPARGPRGWEAFRWTESTGMEALGDLPGGRFLSRAYAVSADGSAVVGESESALPLEAFLWTEAGGMIGLGALDPGFNPVSKALSVSGNGVVVGTSTSSRPPGPTAFIWDELNGIRDLKLVLESEFGLDLTDWELSEAYDISPDGRTIVGTGRHNFRVEAWIATIPEPGTLWLLVIGAATPFKRRSSTL